MCYCIFGDEKMIKLTQRENDILDLMFEGYDNTEIADMIFVSRHTVKAHISAILRKLEAKNRTNAVYIALKTNLIEV